jgi:Asp-tRNA(Asn)/Glu-tRNA(Gln) amidotransferase A subunit family amidase
LPPGVGGGAELWRKLFARPVREVVRETYRGREGEAGPAARAMLKQDSATGRELNSTEARELNSTGARELRSEAEREQSSTGARAPSSTERERSSAGAGGGRGSAVDGGELSAARRERDGLLAGLLRWMKVTPIFVAPVGAVAAFAHGARRVEVGGRTLSTFRAFAHSQAFSALGLPVVTVPAWRTAGGLPVGVQIVGRPREERRVLAAARVVERALGGWQPPPDFASNLRS